MQEKKGFSLIETLIFVAIASFIFVIVANFLIIYGRAYHTFQASSKINASAVTALERITRETKLATSVNVPGSIFNVHPGKLVLNTIDGGTPVTVEFYIDGATLKVRKNSVEIGRLTGDSISVNSLIFYLIKTGDNELVTMRMELQTPLGSSKKNAVFNTSAVLRGTY